jgi:uncharacterized RDD family membrane protein YckC
MTRMSRTSAKVLEGPNHSALAPTDGFVAAPRMARIGGFLIDSLILIPMTVLFWPLLFLYSAGYSSVFGPGRSLGRAAVRQQLVGKDGEPISHAQAVARGLLRTVLWLFILPMFIDMGLFLFGDGRLLVDRMFGTRVAMAPEEARKQKLMARAAQKRSLTEKVEEEADRWDERFEQAELDDIAGELDYEKDDFSDKELDDFEKRLAEAATVDLEPVHIPELEPEGLPLDPMTARPELEFHTPEVSLDSFDDGWGALAEEDAPIEVEEAR